MEYPSMTRVRLVLIFAVGMAVAGCGKTEPAPKVTNETPALAVKAGDLLAEYGANAVAADAKYKGKVIQVTGKFGSAQKAPLLGYAVQVLPESGSDVNLSGVQCFILESEEKAVATMKEGQMITLKGNCDGQVLGQIKVTKCIVVK
jgi:predicted phosphodiesterase